MTDGTRACMGHSWRPVCAYLALTVILLALVPLLGLLTGLSMDFDALGKRAVEKTGVAQTSSLTALLRLCIAEPGLFLLAIGSAVPSLAAILVALASGASNLRLLLARFHPLGRAAPLHDVIPAYAAIFVLMPLTLLFAGALRQFAGGGYAPPANLAGWTLLLGLLTAGFLDQGALLEELGWRGYAQNEMQCRLLSPLTAALAVGLCWGLWHVPRDVFAGVIERLGPIPYLFLYLPSFVSGTIAVSVIAAYFVNRCAGSVWPAIIVHGLANDAVGLSGAATIVQALTPYHQITKALPLALAALVIAALAGRELGRRRPATPAT